MSLKTDLNSVKANVSDIWGAISRSQLSATDLEASMGISPSVDISQLSFSRDTLAKDVASSFRGFREAMHSHDPFKAEVALKKIQELLCASFRSDGLRSTKETLFGTPENVRLMKRNLHALSIGLKASEDLWITEGIGADAGVRKSNKLTMDCNIEKTRHLIGCAQAEADAFLFFPDATKVKGGGRRTPNPLLRDGNIQTITK